MGKSHEHEIKDAKQEYSRRGVRKSKNKIMISDDQLGLSVMENSRQGDTGLRQGESKRQAKETESKLDHAKRMPWQAGEIARAGQISQVMQGQPRAGHK